MHDGLFLLIISRDPQETLSSVFSTVSGCAVNKAHVVLILGLKKKKHCQCLLFDHIHEHNGFMAQAAFVLTLAIFFTSKPRHIPIYLMQEIVIKSTLLPALAF